MVDESTQSRITEVIEGNQVVLFMKGTRHFPQCGFSATCTQILDGLVSDYHTVNVLKDPEIRQAIKEYSNWPTIPQLYVGGKFIGGCDILREMFLEGELHSVLGVEDKSMAPKVTLTEAARKAFAAATEGENGILRLEVSSSFEYALALDEKGKGDFEVDAGGVSVLVDRDSASRADGIVIDYSDAGDGGFKINNPNEPARVQQLEAGKLKQMLHSSEELRLIDVRTEEERAKASIDGARLLDPALTEELEALDRDSVLVFHCHHGGRSQAAAERFVELGFRKVYNLSGGIDAWSQQVDDSVQRY